MNSTQIKGTEFFVNAKDQNTYELSLIIQNQPIHTFEFNLDNYTKMINHLKQTNFSQDTDYSLDSERMSSFYITRWTSEGVPVYCARAAINNEWSAYSIIKEQDLKMLPENLEKLIIAKAPAPIMPKIQASSELPPLPRANALPQIINNTPKEIIDTTQPVDLEALRKEMLGFLEDKKKNFKGQ